MKFKSIKIFRNLIIINIISKYTLQLSLNYREKKKVFRRGVETRTNLLNFIIFK